MNRVRVRIGLGVGLWLGLGLARAMTGNSPDKLRHQRSDASSAQVLLNKQVMSGVAKLIWTVTL